jgi:hypothetical protein
MKKNIWTAVVESLCLCYKLEGRGFKSRCQWIAPICIILPASLCPVVYSASNKNVYQKQKKIMFLGSRARSLYKALSLSLIQLSRQCGILNTSKPYRPPRPVMVITLLNFFTFYFMNCSIHHDIWYYEHGDREDYHLLGWWLLVDSFLHYSSL